MGIGRKHEGILWSGLGCWEFGIGAGLVVWVCRFEEVCSAITTTSHNEDAFMKNNYQQDVLLILDIDGRSFYRYDHK